MVAHGDASSTAAWIRKLNWLYYSPRNDTSKPFNWKNEFQTCNNTTK